MPYGLGEVFNILRKPNDNATYRVLRVGIKFTEQKPQIDLTLACWMYPNTCKDGESGATYTMDITLDGTLANAQGIAASVLALIRAELPGFEGAFSEEFVAYSDCGICGAKQYDREKHLAHPCGVCGERFESGDHSEHNGYPAQPTDDVPNKSEKSHVL